MMHVRYSDEFLSRNGVTWRVDILQDAAAPFEVKGLVFEADDALVIEWSDKDKEEAVIGSIATLKIESPDDRTYADLYTVVPGAIRLDVYRENTLYWSGALDPEFYEEPYERAANYVVSLTFSDFGIWDRIKYTLSGMQTFRALVDDAIARGGIYVKGIDESLISSAFDNKAKVTLSSLSVRSENFYDEDGEAATMKEVVESVLQPLGLRIQQRAGHIWVYDLNALHAKAGAREIVWNGDSSTMGVDKAANSARITFSPYADAKLLTGEEIKAKDVKDTNQIHLDITDNNVHTYFPSYGEKYHRAGVSDRMFASFALHTTTKGEGVAYLSPHAQYFKIQPIEDAEETNGIAWSWMVGCAPFDDTHKTRRRGSNILKAADMVVFKTKRVYIPDLGDRSSEYYLRLSLDALIDARYNPYTDGDDEGNEKGNYNKLTAWAGWVFLPIGVTLYNEQGAAMMHYVNQPIMSLCASGSFAGARGHWEGGAATFGKAWVAYYDLEDPREKAGIQGWKTNKHCIGRIDNIDRFDKAEQKYIHPFNKEEMKRIYKPVDWWNFKVDLSVFLFESFKKHSDGEYIPYPPTGGYIEITVYAGGNGYDYGEPINLSDADIQSPNILRRIPPTTHWDSKKLYSTLRWFMYKAPKLEVINNRLGLDDTEIEDVEYTGEIQKSAKEEISLELKCGTVEHCAPSARGVIYNTSTKQQVYYLTRAGVRDCPERLLIRTLCSQYAERRTTLSGDAELNAESLCAFTEANQEGKKFMLKSEVQNLITDTAEAVFVEFVEDYIKDIKTTK